MLLSLLDILSNDIMVSALLNSHCCAVLVSEENEEPIIVPAENAGRFCVAFDPLDDDVPVFRGLPSLDGQFVGLLAEDVRKKHIELEVDFPEAMLWVHVDVRALQHVVMNIFANALESFKLLTTVDNNWL